MITLIRGLPGSGKSTLARAFAARTGALHLEADMYFVQDGAYRYDSAHIAEAHAWCRNLLRDSSKHGGDVIVANTFTQRREIDGYVLGLKQPYRVIHCTANGDSIHSVPVDVLARMAARWEVFTGEVPHDWRAPLSESPVPY